MKGLNNICSKKFHSVIKDLENYEDLLENLSHENFMETE